MSVWGTPGGGIEGDEDVATALRRELAEELGLDDFSIGPQVWERVHIIPFLDGRWDGQHDRFYLVDVEPFEPAPRLSVEQLRAENLFQIRWWTQDELASFVPIDVGTVRPAETPPARGHVAQRRCAPGSDRNGRVTGRCISPRPSDDHVDAQVLSSALPTEPHRTATSLELLYDLCFVVAVAQISSELHHLLVERRFADGVIGFSAAFFGIWWAWVNYVWFASGHDSDDVPFRLLTLVQMAGVLVLAAGVHDAMEHFDFTTMTIGYVVMRLGTRRDVAARGPRPARPPAAGDALRHRHQRRAGAVAAAARPARRAARSASPASSCSPSSNWPFRSGPSGSRRPSSSTPGTSPNASACSRSSSSAR